MVALISTPSAPAMSLRHLSSRFHAGRHVIAFHKRRRLRKRVLWVLESLTYKHKSEVPLSLPILPQRLKDALQKGIEAPHE